MFADTSLLAAPCVPLAGLLELRLVLSLISSWEGAPQMSSSGSVTELLGRLREGDGEAAQTLLNRYFRPLVKLARRKLPQPPLAIADERKLRRIRNTWTREIDR